MNRCLSFTILIAMLAMVSPAFAQDPELTSEGLEQRVDFWKKIYTQYGKDDIVIHDVLRVNLIYDVANDDNYPEKMVSIQATLREIRAGLDMPEAFSPEAKQLADAIVAQGINLNAAELDALISSVHTQRGIKERFRDRVVRSGRHVDSFREILRRNGVPEELALLPLVESSFENVRSKAGAVGIWQFTRGTGKLYLRINNKVDERLDPTIAATAAARLLRDNYNALQDWPLAITAYNHGRGGMLRAQGEHGSDLVSIINEYRGPVFGYASMNFYSEFLAAVDIYNNYTTYFGELVLDQPNSQRTVQVAAAAPKKPAAKSSSAKTAKASAPEKKYKVQRGDTLWEVAQRFGTTIRSLMEMNNLNESAIYAGQILLVK
jgi:membrane-bound lytic murein transglycosylase D